MNEAENIPRQNPDVLKPEERLVLLDASYRLCQIIIQDFPSLNFDWISPETSGRVMEQTVGRTLQLVAEARRHAGGFRTRKLPIPQSYRMLAGNSSGPGSEAIVTALELEEQQSTSAEKILQEAFAADGTLIMPYFSWREITHLRELDLLRQDNTQRAQEIQKERAVKGRHGPLIVIDEVAGSADTAKEIRRAHGVLNESLEMCVYVLGKLQRTSYPWVKGAIENIEDVTNLEFIWSDTLKRLRGVRKAVLGDRRVIEETDLSPDEQRQKVHLEREFETIAQEVARRLLEEGAGIVQQTIN